MGSLMLPNSQTCYAAVVHNKQESPRAESHLQSKAQNRDSRNRLESVPV